MSNEMKISSNMLAEKDDKMMEALTDNFRNNKIVEATDDACSLVFTIRSNAEEEGDDELVDEEGGDNDEGDDEEGDEIADKELVDNNSIAKVLFSDENVASLRPNGYVSFNGSKECVNTVTGTAVIDGLINAIRSADDSLTADALLDIGKKYGVKANLGQRYLLLDSVLALKMSSSLPASLSTQDVVKNKPPVSALASAWNQKDFRAGTTPLLNQVMDEFFEYCEAHTVPYAYFVRNKDADEVVIDFLTEMEMIKSVDTSAIEEKCAKLFEIGAGLFAKLNSIDNEAKKLAFAFGAGINFLSLLCFLFVINVVVQYVCQ
jgi:hypothetical protein